MPYDIGFVLTGENPSFRSRSKHTLDLYIRGVIARIFISGGYGGLREDIPKKTECQEMADHFISQGVPARHIYQDPRPLDTLGNFAFPFGDPLPGNPNLEERSLILITEANHLLRAKECAKATCPGREFPSVNAFGDYVPRIGTNYYHRSLMEGLKRFHSTNPQEALIFLKKNHPFYTEGWMDKPVWLREGIMFCQTLVWRWGEMKSCRDPYFQVWESGRLD